MENGIYLFVVTGLIWAVVFGYVFFISVRQKRLQQEINTLKNLAQGNKKV